MRVTVYIRPDNIDKWQSIPNKSDYVNSLLSGDYDLLERKIRRIVDEVVAAKLSELQSNY